MRILLGGWRRLACRVRQRRKASTGTKVEEGPEPPNGFLFNEKPLLPGEKRVKEPWENLWVYGMGFNFVLMFIVAVFKPDNNSISKWSKQQALERLAAQEAAASEE